MVNTIWLFDNIIVAAAAAAKSLQSCPTLCNSVDGSPPGSAVSGILQARTLKWAAISFSRAWKWKVKVKSLSDTATNRKYGVDPTYYRVCFSYAYIPFWSKCKLISSIRWKQKCSLIIYLLHILCDW